MAGGGGLEKGPDTGAMINYRAVLISTLPCLRAESLPRDARRPVRLGLAGSKERRASGDQSRTSRGFSRSLSDLRRILCWPAPLATSEPMGARVIPRISREATAVPSGRLSC